MPGFERLAREIAEDVIGWDDSFRDRLDRYLGTAVRQMVAVHVRARERLNPAGRTHTPLHEHLIGVFERPESVRLITTNFEPFFDNAANVVFPGALAGGVIRKYVGPALPPGRNFAGIVQLHGALSNSQDALVLTDRDFAEAYLSEGWAARFLLQVFPQRTILFVGYRLGDPVIQYLMRAMAPTNRWFALCHDSEQETWRDMEITPVPFATPAEGQKFQELNDGMKRWHWYASATVVDHDKVLREMIEKGPPRSAWVW